MRVIPICLLLAGCAATPTAIPIKIQVPVPCLTTNDLPIRPQISSDADLLKMADGDLILSVAADRIALRAYAGEMDAVIQACIR